MDGPSVCRVITRAIEGFIKPNMGGGEDSSSGMMKVFNIFGCSSRAKVGTNVDIGLKTSTTMTRLFGKDATSKCMKDTTRGAKAKRHFLG